MNWNSLILHYEIHIRLGFFFAVFVPMALWEMAAPRRALGISKRLRWINNLGMVFLNSLILRLLFPAAAAGMAALAAARGWGLLNYFELPFWLAFYAKYTLAASPQAPSTIIFGTVFVVAIAMVSF